MYWVLKHSPMNSWCEYGKDRLKTKGCRAQCILRNVWCELEKDQLKTLGFTVFTRNRQIFPPGGHKWNRSVPKIDWHLKLGPTHIWCKYEENRLKLRSLWSAHKKTPFGPLVATNGIAPKIYWCLDLGTRDM